ncbi:MAG TPA: T9SS type A sorting domain-containing protein, partial [Bacteroidia bacterium]|nr:T9SS type A sorting domain-containing protein [Bacteroidia bacterium]
IDFPGQPAALEVYNNELWMFGGFTTVIGIPACVARWNGTDWCTVGDTFYPSGVSDAAVYNNELYICGGFRSINGDTVNFISKWVGGNYSDSCGNTTGVEEPTRAILPLVYPNPASDIVTFQFSGSPESRSIIIYDQLGKEVWREETNESSMIISLQEFAEGIYFYSIINEAGQSTTGKFIVAR